VVLITLPGGVETAAPVVESEDISTKSVGIEESRSGVACSGVSLSAAGREAFF
jgi:hypothetical protein